MRNTPRAKKFEVLTLKAVVWSVAELEGGLVDHKLFMV